jgi:pyruvate dehydrogenase E2 component (dihydrolipoamide acetyltransferase)
MSELNDMLMPKLGLTMTEGTLSEWSIAPGDRVSPGDLMFVVETDKVATEIIAEAEGELREIVVPVGETVPVGAVVGRWTGPGQGTSQDEKIQDEVPVDASAAPQPDNPAAGAVDGARVIATPLARRLAREHGLELVRLTGSGPRGRIKAEDVRAAAQGSANTAEVQTSPDSVSADPHQTSPASGMVQAMARRMVEAKQQVPHFYLAAEAEVTKLLDLRGQLNAQEGYDKLTLNHMVLAAVVRALEVTPEQNRIFLDNQIVQFQNVDVGMAVSTERGLLAPVIKDLAGRNVDEIAGRARSLQQRVVEGSAGREDMQGGAITVSNGGMFNVTYMTPIINPPQSAILGVGSIREVFRPDDNGRPALRREMGLVLAADHRLHDGESSLVFLNRIIDALQQPQQLLRPRAPFRRG